MKLHSWDIYSYGIALLMALVLHAVIIALMTMNWGEAEIGHLDMQPYYIEASIVSENPYTAEKEREANREKTERQKRIQARRLTEKQLAAEQAAWEKAQAEKRRREAAAAAAQPEPAPEATSEPVEAEAQQAITPDFESDLARMLEREANARKAVTDDERAMAYVSQIQREIIQNWSRPPSARNGMQALLRVHLIPTGEVVDVKLEQSSGNDAFDRSAILAVRKADRFIVPGDTRQFEKNFREFTVLFRPDDLRL